MKKHNLFKVIVLTFLAVVVLTWIIPAGGYGSGEFASSGRTPLGLFDLVRTPLIAFANLMQYGYIVLIIGGFYGVLSKTGAYASLLEKCSKKINGKKFLVAMIVVLAALESLTGATFAIFIIVPFLASLVLKKGYGKITAMASTVGALLLGSMAATYDYGILGNLTQYLAIEFDATLIPRIVFFVISVILYSFIVVRNAKVQMIEIEEEIEVEEKAPRKRASKTAAATKSSKSKAAKETKTSKTKTKAETKGKKDEIKVTKKKIKKIRKEIAPVEIPFVDETVKAKKTTALLVYMIILLVFTIVAMFNWSSVLQVEFFNELHTKIAEVKIGSFPIFSNILGTFSTLGTWTNYDLIIFLIPATFVIGFIYSVKLDDMIDGFVNGVKCMAKPAFLVVLATTIYATMFSSATGDNIFYTIVHKLLGVKGSMSLFAAGIVSGIGSLIYSDFSSLVGSVAAPFGPAFHNTMKVASFVLQTIYGAVSFVSPACILTILGLSYFDISYKEWFKYIWKFLVGCIIVVAVIAFILVK